MLLDPLMSSFFFFNDTATTEIYTLSLHDALPIWLRPSRPRPSRGAGRARRGGAGGAAQHRRGGQRGIPPCDADRKSTRLNSSHLVISYALFCLKKKKMASPTSLTTLTQTHHLPRP